MGKKPDPAQLLFAQKLARLVVNVIASHPVRILLEPPVESSDDFALQLGTQGKPVSGGVTFGPISTRLTVSKTYVVIEFDHIGEKAIYKLLHFRGGAGEPEHDLIDSHVLGSALIKPQWRTPGQPPTTPPKKSESRILSPRRSPPKPHDPLLHEDVKDFAQVPVDEAKIQK